ncbi:hypothetical protein SBY92_003148 [Candida maltosa Xu316]
MSTKRKIPLAELEDLDNDDDYQEVINDDVDFYGNQTPSMHESKVATPIDEGEIDHVVSQVVRLFLTRELLGKPSKPDVIRKFVKHNLGRKFTTDMLIQQADVVLKDVYGLAIQETPNLNNAKKQPKKPRKAAGERNAFIVVSDLSPQARNVLGELWQRDLARVTKKTDINTSKFFLPKYNKSCIPGSHHQLVKDGIMLVIISIIILNENHIQEDALLKSLRKVGLPPSLNVKNSNLNMNTVELIKELKDHDYLSENVIKGSSESENIIDYSLGKRSLVEFTPHGVFEYIKIIYGDRFDTSVAERALVTIERAYGVVLNTNEESKEVTEEPDGEQSVET